MSDKIERMLEEEIEREIEKLSSLEPWGDEYSTVVEALTKLYKLRIEETKNAKEAELKEQQIDDEAELRGSQLERDTKHQYLKLGVEIAGLISTLLFNGVWMKRGFRFEETGSFTSTTFRTLFSHFRPTRK